MSHFDHRAEQDMIRANPAVTLRTMLTTSSLLKPLLIAVMMMLAQQGTTNSMVSQWRSMTYMYLLIQNQKLSYVRGKILTYYQVMNIYAQIFIV